MTHTILDVKKAEIITSRKATPNFSGKWDGLWTVRATATDGAVWLHKVRVSKDDATRLAERVNAAQALRPDFWDAEETLVALEAGNLVEAA